MIGHRQRKHEDVKKDHDSIMDTCAGLLASHCTRSALSFDPQVADSSLTVEAFARLLSGQPQLHSESAPAEEPDHLSVSRNPVLQRFVDADSHNCKYFRPFDAPRELRMFVLMDRALPTSKPLRTRADGRP